MPKLYHLTDLHGFSKSNWKGCDPYEAKRLMDQISYRETEDILDKAIDIILEDKEINIVIVTGDMTSCGDMESHNNVIERLRKLVSAGKKVFAFTASHDFPWAGCAFILDKDGNKQKINSGYTDFKNANELYKEFGYNQALAVNPENYSFVVELDEKTRFMAVCVDYYNEHLPDITENSRKWIKEQAERAKEDGVELVAGCHHPVLVPSPIYRAMGGGDVIKCSDEIVELFTECGIKLVLTGHSHIHDIEFHSDKNGTLYDVATAALSGFPPVMRRVAYEPESGAVDVKTILLTSIENEKIVIDDLYSYCRESFIGFVESLVVSLGNDIEVFMKNCDAISIKPAVIEKNAWWIKPIGKYINNLSFGKLGRWTKKETGYKKEELADIKDKKLVPFIVYCIEKLYAGDADVSPDSKEYRIFMSFIAILDSLIKTLPIKLEKLIGCTSLSELVSPLLYNNGIPDNDATINVNEIPKCKRELPSFSSKKGPFIILIIIGALLCLSPVIIPVGIIVALIVLLKKFFGEKDKQE